jgi:hypothetical protein
MKKILLINLFVLWACSLMAQQTTITTNPSQMDVQTIDALDSVIFDCSQLTGVTGAIEIPVSIKSDDIVYALDFSLKYDHTILQYDTTVNATTYLQGLSYYFSTDSTIRFTSSTFSPCTNDTTLAIVKFMLIAPSTFANGSIYTLKGYLNGTLCSSAYVPLSPVGLSENVMANFTVYPNPAQDAVSINFDNANRIELINLMGQTVYSENVEGLNSTNINTSEYVNGIYFVKLYTSKGNGIHKLIVSH